MSEMLKDFPILEGILSGDSSLGGKMTVFMPSDLTITNLREETRKNIFVNQSDKALRVCGTFHYQNAGANPGIFEGGGSTINFAFQSGSTPSKSVNFTFLKQNFLKKRGWVVCGFQGPSLWIRH